MDTVSLQAQTRTVHGKQCTTVREAGMIPAVMYGKNKSARSLSVQSVPFEKVLRLAGESTLIDLVIDKNAPCKALIHEVSRDHVTGKFMHIDFFEVDMTQKLSTSIPLVFTGESKAVKELGGILVRNMESLDVKCLPSDLVHEIMVDISQLKTFDDIITVADIAVPKGIEVLNHKGDGVAIVTPPISEEELKELESKPVEDVASVQDAEKKKKGEASEEK